MSRRLAGRGVLDGTLVATTPLHVGSGMPDAQSDLPLLRDAAGRLVIPGTSIAGALRDWVRVAHGVMSEQRLFGPPPAGRNEDDDNTPAGLVEVSDAYVDEASPVTELRDGVGIDRVTGAAAEEIKHDRVVLAGGTRLDLRLTLDLPPGVTTDAAGEPNHPDLEILRQLAAALATGHLRLGAAQTRGLGRVTLENQRLRWVALDSRTATLDLVEHGDDAGLLLGIADAPARHDTELTIAWTPALPVLVGAGAQGNAIDALPLRSATRTGFLAPVLPGSSIKGVLRARAERIVRTVLGLPPLDPARQRHLDQLDVPLVRELFGVAPLGRDRQGDARRGAVGVDDCYARLELPDEQWQAIQTAARGAGADEMAAVRAALHIEGGRDWVELDPKREPPRFAVPAMHNVLDRWTGGTVAGLLFSQLELHGCEWDPIVLTLRPRLLEEHGLAAIGLLWIVLRDLRDSQLSFGGGGNRGLGAVRDVDVVQSGAFTVEEIECDGGWWMADEAPGVLVDAWTAWIAEKT